MKKVIALLCSLLVCFSLTMNVFAADGDFVGSVTPSDQPGVSSDVEGDDLLIDEAPATGESADIALMGGAMAGASALRVALLVAARRSKKN